jgi:hypothetical protein
MKVASR